ncbi:MAG: hypothetical protein KDA32_05505 [Phycisphaerales bacterium]|nr:hypothetical protein [Phycisphaerales bacterium]
MNGRKIGLTALIFATFWTLAGCGGLRWNLTAEPAYSQSREASKLTFFYFRSWASVACTRFEDQALSDPAVEAALAEMTPIKLDIIADRALAGTFGVTKPPAIVIANPAGKALVTREGEMTKEEVLAAIDEARSGAPRGQ